MEVVTEWVAAGGPRPAVQRPCPVYGCEGGITQDLPDDITRAEEEVALPDGSVADVVLYRGDAPAAAVEVVVTHRVAREKGRRLSLPWMELEAEALLERPYWWVAVQDGLRPFTCPVCRRREAGVKGRVAEVAARARAAAREEGLTPPPGGPYHSAAHRCGACGAPMLLHVWPGCTSRSGRPPPDPRPAGLRRRSPTDPPGPPWVQPCPSCGTVPSDEELLAASPDYAFLRQRRAGLDDVGF